jgi:hypothetical protein
MVKEIATYLRGWLGYFGDCQTPSVLQRLESWLRRRLRSVVWKQWKRGRTRFRELRKRDCGRGGRATFPSMPILPHTKQKAPDWFGARLLYFLPSQLTFLYPKEKALDWLGGLFSSLSELAGFLPGVFSASFASLP